MKTTDNVTELAIEVCQHLRDYCMRQLWEDWDRQVWIDPNTLIISVRDRGCGDDRYNPDEEEVRLITFLGGDYNLEPGEWDYRTEVEVDDWRDIEYRALGGEVWQGEDGKYNEEVRENMEIQFDREWEDMVKALKKVVGEHEEEAE